MSSAASQPGDLSYLYALFLNQPPYEGRMGILRFGSTPYIRLLAPDGSTPDQTYVLPPPFYRTHGLAKRWGRREYGPSTDPSVLTGTKHRK